MAERSQNLQDLFLNTVRKQKISLTIFLINGVKLTGVVTSFDNFCVLLRRDGHSQLVYKHAIRLSCRVSRCRCSKAKTALPDRTEIITSRDTKNDSIIPEDEKPRDDMRAVVIVPVLKAGRPQPCRKVRRLRRAAPMMRAWKRRSACPRH